MLALAVRIPLAVLDRSFINIHSTEKAVAPLTPFQDTVTDVHVCGDTLTLVGAAGAPEIVKTSYNTTSMNKAIQLYTHLLTSH